MGYRPKKDMYEYKCSICGKHISLLSPYDYVYKVGIKNGLLYQCSYSCYKSAGGDGGHNRQDIIKSKATAKYSRYKDL